MERNTFQLEGFTVFGDMNLTLGNKKEYFKIAQDFHGLSGGTEVAEKIEVIWGGTNLGKQRDKELNLCKNVAGQCNCTPMFSSSSTQFLLSSHQIQYLIVFLGEEFFVLCTSVFVQD